MTPAPISVERFDPEIGRELLDPATETYRQVAVMEPFFAGEYVRHSDYAALLHQLAELERDNATMRGADYHQVGVEQEQEIIDLEAKLAERDAEVERLRDVMRDADAAFLAMLERSEAAERAKEEFRLLASLRLFHAPTIGYCWFERCGVSWTGKAHATINEANAEKTAAFLAASGGAREA